jgi:hypothetical protein
MDMYINGAGRRAQSTGLKAKAGKEEKGRRGEREIIYVKLDFKIFKTVPSRLRDEHPRSASRTGQDLKTNRDQE